MEKRQKELIGIICFVLSMFILISIISFLLYPDEIHPSGSFDNFRVNNFMGQFGIWINHFLIFRGIGLGAIVVPIVLFLIGMNLFLDKRIKNIYKTIIYLLLLGIWISVLIAFIANYFKIDNLSFHNNYAGSIGYWYKDILFILFGNSYAVGALLAISFLILISRLIESEISDITNNFKKGISDIYYFINNQFKKIKSVFEKNKIEQKQIENVDEAIPIEQEEVPIIDSDYHNQNNSEEQLNNNVNEADASNEMVVSDSNIQIDKQKEIDKANVKLFNSTFFKYKLPTLKFLIESKEQESNISKEEYNEKAEQLIYALKTFGVDGQVVKISPGPVITLFEIEPAEGVRVSKFTNLSDDLARVMKAQRIRVIAPIPGSKSVGIELPNVTPSIVYLRDIIASKKFAEHDSKLTIALGKKTSGDAYVFDLSKMPHLLVAGATGTGKSVCINTLIISILYKAKPDEVKFILIDPKKLELANYKALINYHLVTAMNLNEYVMTTAENAVGILESAISEMERRFSIFADVKVRNIAEYNAKQKNNNELEKVPYIVVVIDELADIMMTSSKAIEEPITRLAQKARAVGIHLVVATQRPSVDVITGLIKSNFPARMSFQVSSRVDSRTIIDQMGAEKLLGNGDMLFLLPGAAIPIRIHSSFITLNEIERVLEHITKQQKPNSFLLPEIKKKKQDSTDLELNQFDDELLEEAAFLVVRQGQASVSLLQRKFRIGYSRAGRLIDDLEARGIISGYSGSKARDVLVDEFHIKELFENK